MKRQNIALASKRELHKYLVKVRRHKVGDELDLRAKDDLSMLLADIRL